MKNVIIVGAGLSGCLLTLSLVQRGFRVTIIDRFLTYPDEFRAEQIVGGQLNAFRQFGVLNQMLAGHPSVPQAQAYRGHRPLKPLSTPHLGLPYQNMVAAVRSLLPKEVPFVVGRAINIEGGSNPTVHLDTGQTISGDLIVMATGLNTCLSKELGVTQESLAQRPTVTVGFDVLASKFSGPHAPVLVYYGSNLRYQIDYLTIFPFKRSTQEIGLRGNLFLYCETSSPWLHQLRRQPKESLSSVFPALAQTLGNFSIGHVQIRVSKVTKVSNHLQDGVVFIGDAYQTPCPAAGTGINRLLMDVQRLTEHVMRWRSMGDVSVASLTSFYDDTFKREADRMAIHDARFRRGISAEPGLIWNLHRGKIFLRHWADSIVRPTREQTTLSEISGSFLQPTSAADF